MTEADEDQDLVALKPQEEKPDIFGFVLSELSQQPSALANKEDFIYIENIIKIC
jgi:hypothetical protein